MIGVNGVKDSAESKTKDTFSGPQNAHTDSGGIPDACCKITFPPEDIWRHWNSENIFLLIHKRRRKDRRHRPVHKKRKKKETYFIINATKQIQTQLEKHLNRNTPLLTTNNYYTHSFSLSTLNSATKSILLLFWTHISTIKIFPPN
jgi:hypothetical protein